MVGICWFPNTNFFGVDTKPLFDDIFFPKSTIQQGGDYIRTTKFGLKDLKKSEITCQILEVDIYGGETEYDCQIYKQL